MGRGLGRSCIEHVTPLVENLTSAAEWVRRSLLEPGTDDEKAGDGAPFEVSWQELARYWRKKSG